MIYMDNAATKLGNFGLFNINSPYAREQKESFEIARENIAIMLNVNPEHIYFTSGGCEANSWALQRCGVKHIITTKIEHSSVLNCCKWLERHGCTVTYLDVDRHGYVSPLDLDRALTLQSLAPTLVSIMYVNNEIGTVQNIKALREVIDKHNKFREQSSTETLMDFAEHIYFHSDCVQASHIDIPIECLDMASFSGHKFGKNFGVGFLYSRIPLEPLIFGGSQEHGLRGGTSNSAAVMEMALSFVDAHLNKNPIHIMIRYLKDCLVASGLDYVINTPDDSESNILSVSFKDADAEGLMIFLSDFEVYVSAGSACETDHKEPSHVLKAIGVPNDYINGTIRFSLSENTKPTEVIHTIKLIKEYINAKG